MLNIPLFERYNVLVNCIYRQTSKFLFSSMAGMVAVMNQDMNETVIASNVQGNSEGNGMMYVPDRLKGGGNYLAEIENNDFRNIEKLVPRSVYDRGTGRCFRELI